VLAGRGFSTGAGAALREALIDRTLAAEFFPGASPVGYRLPVGDDTVTVVGVVEHARLYDVHEDGRPQMYFRDEYDPDRSLSFALRTERDPETLVPEVRAAIRRIDPQLAVADVQPMDEIVKQALRQPRVSAVLIAGFSLGALLLAAMGLFGVVAGSVNRRRHEIAVRLALGAEYGGVLRLVLREGAALVVLGLLVGVPGIYFAGRILRGVLVGVSPFDPPTLGAVAAGLALVALAACYIPARRVAAIEPAQAFRDE
jgi:putative ABC transport system permease protein